MKHFKHAKLLNNYKIHHVISRSTVFFISSSSQLEQISNISKPTELSFISISCGNEHALLLSSDHRVFTLGSGSRGQLGNGSTDYHQELVELDILYPVKIVQIKAGGWHCLALSGYNSHLFCSDSWIYPTSMLMKIMSLLQCCCEPRRLSGLPN